VNAGDQPEEADMAKKNEPIMTKEEAVDQWGALKRQLKAGAITYETYCVRKAPLKKIVKESELS